MWSWHRQEQKVVQGLLSTFSFTQMPNHRSSADVSPLRPGYKDLISAPFCLNLLLLKTEFLNSVKDLNLITVNASQYHFLTNQEEHLLLLEQCMLLNRHC